MFRLNFVLGCVFRKGVLPEGLAKELPQILKFPKCLDSIDCTMILSIATFKLDAKKNTAAFKHVPNQFRIVIFIKTERKWV